MANLNRQQRRAAAKQKRRGETYADVLSRKQLAKLVTDHAIHDCSVQMEANIRTQRVIWMAVVALNEAFGFGGERAKKFMLALENVANDFEKMAIEGDGDYAVTKLMQRCEQITGMEVREIYKDEMQEIGIKHEAEGIFFPEKNTE